MSQLRKSSLTGNRNHLCLSSRLRSVSSNTDLATDFRPDNHSIDRDFSLLMWLRAAERLGNRANHDRVERPQPSPSMRRAQVAVAPTNHSWPGPKLLARKPAPVFRQEVHKRLVVTNRHIQEGHVLEPDASQVTRSFMIHCGPLNSRPTNSSEPATEFSLRIGRADDTPHSSSANARFWISSDASRAVNESSPHRHSIIFRIDVWS